MPSLTLEVTDAQWERIKAAFTAEGVPPTAATMRDWIFTQIKAQVWIFEMAQLAQAKSNAVAEVEAATQVELINEGW